MAYTIVKANLKLDADKILQFWKKNFSAWPSEKFEWFYLNNIRGLADCWFLLDSQVEQIIGVAAVFPRVFYHNGAPLSVGIAADFAVDKNHRTLGAALQLQKSIVKYCGDPSYVFIYGYPNPRSEIVQKRVGFKKNCSISRFVRVLQTRRLMANHIKNKYLLTFLSFICDCGLFLFARESRIRRDARYTFEVLDCPDDRFDFLWEKARIFFSFIGERSRAFLTWRFAQCPYREYKFFTVTDTKNNALIGYIIYYEYERTVCVADVLYLDINIFSSVILPGFIKSINKYNFDNISILTNRNNGVVNFFKKFLFIKRDEDRNLMVYSSSNFLDVNSELNPIYFFEADND